MLGAIFAIGASGFQILVIRTIILNLLSFSPEPMRRFIKINSVRLIFFKFAALFTGKVERPAVKRLVRAISALPAKGLI